MSATPRQPKASARQTRSGRKKTSDQAVSDPTAVCLPNMTADDRLSPRRQSHSLFTMLDIFAHHAATGSHRALTLAAGGKLSLSSDTIRMGKARTSRPHPRQPYTGSRASPKKSGARRDRTDDLMLAKHALSQLSYVPEGVSCSR